MDALSIRTIEDDVRHPRFRLDRLLGRGGFGAVYAAFDHELGAVVALKSLERMTPSAIARFKEEFRSLSSLTHPCLPTLYDLFFKDERWFFTMELIDGRPWLDAVGAGPRKSDPAPASPTTVAGHDTLEPTAPLEARAASYDERALRASIDQLADVVHYIHAHGRVHRDIKPSNILVTPHGHVSLLDFGLVSDVSARATRFEGTPPYAAPEQLLGLAVGPKADWYAIGTMLFQVLCGRLPFESGGAQLVKDKTHTAAPSVRALAPGAPPDLAALCDALLARDPSQRGTLIAPATSRVAPRFVGRRAELDVLLAELRGGKDRPRVVQLVGEAGIGKTALIRELTRRALAEGADVLCGTASTRERVPYAALDPIADHLATLVSSGALSAPSELGALARLFPALRALFPNAREPEAPDRRNVVTRAAEALCQLLTERAASCPVLVCIDDHQWIDEDSLDLLDRVFAHRAAPPVLLLLASRPGGTPGAPSSARQLVLRALEPDDAAALLNGHQETGAADAAEGHPLFLLQLAESGIRTAVGDLDELIALRLRALDPTARSVVALCCLSRAPLTEVAAARAAEERTVDVSRSLRRLASAKLLRAELKSGHTVFAPYHERIRDAARKAIDEAHVPRLHARIARELDETSDADAVAYHLEHAGDAAAAAAVCLRGADRAAERFAYHQAAAYLADALRLGGGDAAQRLALMSRRIRLLTLSQRARAAAEECVSAAVLTSSETERFAFRERAARLFLTCGEHERGLALMRELLEEQGERMPETRLQTLGALVRERLVGSVRTAGVARDDRDALRRRHAVVRGVAETLAMVDNARASLFHLRALHLAHAIGDPQVLAEAIVIDAWFHGLRGTPEREDAQRRLRRAEALSPTLRTRAWVEVVEAAFERQATSSPAAIARVERAAARFAREQTGDVWVVVSLAISRAFAHRVRSDFPTLRRVVPELLADARERADRFLETTIQRGSAIMHLAADEPDTAQELLDATVWRTPPGAVHLQDVLERESRIELALYRGAPPDADREGLSHLRFSPIRRMQSMRVVADFALARALVARARLGPARRRALLEARLRARSLAREALDWALVWSELLIASIALAERDRSGALAALERAQRTAAHAGLEVLAALASFGRVALERGDLLAADPAPLVALGVVRPVRFIGVYVVGIADEIAAAAAAQRLATTRMRAAADSR